MQIRDIERELAMELHISEAEAAELLLEMGMVKCNNSGHSNRRITLESYALLKPQAEAAI